MFVWPRQISVNSGCAILASTSPDACRCWHWGSRNMYGWDLGEQNVGNGSRGWTELENCDETISVSLWERVISFWSARFYKTGHLYYYNQQEVWMQADVPRWVTPTVSRHETKYSFRWRRTCRDPQSILLRMRVRKMATSPHCSYMYEMQHNSLTKSYSYKTNLFEEILC